MAEETAPATVLWWHESPGGLTSWLVVGSGPHPFTDQAWVHQLAVVQPGAGGWAVANQPSLGPLPERIAARLPDPIGPPGDARSAVFGAEGERRPGEAAAELREQCLDAALELVARRLEDPIVSSQPRQSGVELLRLRTDGSQAFLDIAPAIREPGPLGRSISTDLRDARVQWGAGHEDPAHAALEDGQFDSAAVPVGATTVQLPVVSLPLALPDGAAADPALTATVEITLPTLWRSDVPEPVVTLRLVAGPG